MSRPSHAQVLPANVPSRAANQAAPRPVAVEDRLRIAVFVSEFPALSETFVMRQVVALLDRGHEVVVFADRPRDEPMTHPDFARYGLAARVRYLSMPAGHAARLVTAIRLGLGRARHHAPVLLRALDPFRHGRDAVNLRMLFWALLLIEEEPFDVLHCHFGPVGRMVAVLRDMGAIDGRLATTFHGNDLTACLRSRPDYYRDLSRRGDLSLPISDYFAARLRAIGFTPEQVVVHRMGVDLDRFADRPRRPVRPGFLRLLTVGRLIDKKGVADALRAVAVARRHGVSMHYTIIGDGPLRASLEALVSDLRIDDVVRFVGWQDQDAVVQALYAHDILLAPSVTAPDGDQEGIPVTIMEAMATAMPVVSTRHSGIPELIEDGISGLLVDEGDHKALAEAIFRLAHKPDLAGSLGWAARRRVAAVCDAEALDDKLDRHLRDLARRED